MQLTTATDGRGRRARPELSPFVLAYAVNPIVFAAFWLLRSWGVIADSPLWVYLIVLWSGAILGTIAELWYRRRPSRAAVHGRVAVQAASVAATTYVTGWGPALALAYAFMAQENVARSGASTWRITAGWSVASIAVGQVLIALGLAPSFLDEAQAHGLAALQALALVFVLRMAGAVTEQKERAEASLRHSEDRFRSLVQNSSDLTIVLDPEGRIEYASEAAVGLLGRSPTELAGLPARELVHPDDLEWVRARVSAGLLMSHKSEPVELRVRHADGTWRDVEAVVANQRDRPSVGGIVVNARDVTERKRIEDELAHQAVHDALTGLPNRLLLVDRLEQALERNARGARLGPIVMFLDLDRFKLVNDGLGHDAGDQLLAAVAGRLRARVRPGDTVARFGGDEFVVLCEGSARQASADTLAKRMLGCFDAPFSVAGEHLQVSASVGVAVWGDHTESAAELVREADAAMYRAKSSGRGRFHIYDAEARDDAALKVQTESALRRALDGDELRVHYQPIVDLRDGEAVAVEALLRWEHPSRGLLTPGAFLDVAEDSGLIVPIGAWVLEEAITQVQAWNQARGDRRPLALSVNVSARQLAEPALLATVRERLTEAAVSASTLDLWLEVTETLMLRDPDAAASLLAELQELGVHVAIDDFGTGYSSLSYLRRFPASSVKIDRSFVAGLGLHAEDDAIVAGVVGLAHGLGLQVTAEGVETDAQLCALQVIGCDFAQGFLLAAPQPADALDGMLGQDVGEPFWAGTRQLGVRQ